MTKVDYTLSGCVNGHPVRIDGSGTATRKEMRVAFAASEAPFTFDANLALFAGLDAVVALTAGIVAATDHMLVARCRADVVGEGCVEVGTLVAQATVEQRRASYCCIAQLAEARIAFEVGERITAIGERAITVLSQPSGVALLSAASIETSRGREMTVLTTAFLVGAEAGSRRSLMTSPTKLGSGAAVIRFVKP